MAIGEDSPPIDYDYCARLGLTTRQIAFVAAYMGRAALNACAAIRLISPKAAKAPLTSMSVQSRKLLHHGLVQRALAWEIARRFGTDEDIKNGLAGIANANAADFLERDSKGKWKISIDKLMAAGQTGLIRKVKGFRGEIVQLEMYDKIRALEVMARIRGMLTDKVQLTGANGGPVEVNVKGEFDWDAYRRAKADSAAIAGRISAPENSN